MRGPQNERNESAAVWALAAAIAISFGVLVALTSRITFFLDDWAVLLHRRGFGFDVVLAPDNEHPVIIPVLIYKALLAAFGMDSARPFQVVSVVAFLVADALLFVWLRRRVGSWLALAAVIPILFLGSAYEDLLWQFQVGYFGSMACGLGALLALERDDRVGDRIACLLLVVAIAFGSLGIPFIIGAAVWVCWDRRRIQRAYIFAVPLLLYAAWWLGYGHTAQSSSSLRNLATAPTYLFDGFSSSVSSLVGLGTPRADSPLVSLDWGRPLLVALGGLALWRLFRIGRIDRRLALVLAMPAAFWILAATNADFARPPTAARYQWIGAVFVLLIAAELIRGIRPRPVLLAGAAILAAASVASNLVALKNGSDVFRELSAIERGGLGGLEIARDSVDPGLTLDADNSNAFYAGLVDARSYFSAVDAFGSPAYPLDQLAAAPESSRVAADKVVAAALGIGLRQTGPSSSAAGCKLVQGADPSAATAVVLPAGGALLEAPPGVDAALALRRYATESFPVELGRVPAGTSSALRIGADRSSQPWELGVGPGTAVRVCELPN